jgi:hypothetical protein
LQEVDHEDLLVAHTEPLNASQVEGSVTVYPFDGTDRICFFGTSMNLEPEIVSFLTENGTDCNNTNGYVQENHKTKRT